MIVSELFIIYLAAAAPFGVARFLSEQSDGAGTLPALLKAAGAALAWPCASLPRLLRRLASRGGGGPSALEGRGPDGERAEHVKRSALTALRGVEDLLEEEAAAPLGEAERHALFNARECVERYAGLALACSSAEAEARPSPREMELCRIAGRGGDDLLVAGRCVHRRNVTRLFAHRERASAELVQALAAVREAAHRLPPPAHSSEQLRAAGAGRISEALPRALSRVVELLSLFDDRATLVAVARMLDAECGRAGGGLVKGEEPCTTQVAPTPFAGPRLRTNTSPGA